MTKKPTFTFREEQTKRRYLVANAPAVRVSDRKFAIMPDRVEVRMQDGWVMSVLASGPSILRNGEFGAQHDFAFSNYFSFSDKAPDWIEELIVSEGLQWKRAQR